MLPFLIDIVVIFALSVAAAVICHRLKLPASIGMLLAGVIAGPHALGLISNASEIEAISQVGVVLLLFVIGLEFSLSDLTHLRRQFFLGGSLQLVGTAAFIGVATYMLGRSAAQSAYLGFVVALSSTAIVLRMLQERAELDAPHGRLVLATLIYQDIAVVPIMLAAPLLAGATAHSGGRAVLILALKVLAVGLFAFAAYRWFVPYLLEKIASTRSSEAFLLGVLTLCIGIAVITQEAGLSLALGAFLAGLIISESDYSHQAVTVMLPFRDVFMSLFFVSLGMLLDTSYFFAHPLLLAELTLGVILIKPLVAGIAAVITGLPLRSAVLAGLALGQIGEFSLVVARAGEVAGLYGNEVFQMVLNTAVLSMLAAPAMFLVAPRLAEIFEKSPLSIVERRRFFSARVGSAHSYQNHILIIGYGVTGRNMARTAQRVGAPYAIIELNAQTAKNAARIGEPIHFGDATQEVILKHVDAEKARAIVVVIDDRAGARRVVELARRIAPEAYILVRTRYLREVGPLHELGADEVIADELEVSIEVFSRVLSRMLVPREEIKGLIGDVRGQWRRMARSFAKEATAVSDLHFAVPDLTTHTLRLTAHSSVVGSTIADANLRHRFGITVLAINRGEESVTNPGGTDVLTAGDVLFVVGPSDWDPKTIL